MPVKLRLRRSALAARRSPRKRRALEKSLFRAIPLHLQQIFWMYQAAVALTMILHRQILIPTMKLHNVNTERRQLSVRKLCYGQLWSQFMHCTGS